jgi:hypothetical protein
MGHCTERKFISRLPLFLSRQRSARPRLSYWLPRPNGDASQRTRLQRRFIESLNYFAARSRRRSERRNGETSGGAQGAERDFLVKRTRLARALYALPAPARGKSMSRDPERFSADGFEVKSVVLAAANSRELTLQILCELSHGMQQDRNEWRLKISTNVISYKYILFNRKQRAVKISHRYKWTIHKCSYM